MTRQPPSKLYLSEDGYKLIAEREGRELEAYLDSRGILTIGLGHTSAAGPPKVRQGMTITEKQAEEIFRRDAQRFRHECADSVKAPLHQYEFDALASFLFNVGSTNFRGSTALKRLNKGEYAGCAEAMLWWNKPPEIVSRRKAEVAQFLGNQFVARLDG
jgi:lysozyme